MSFNRQNEYKIFIAKQKQKEKEYRALGISEQLIQAILDYDRTQFLNDMCFYSHNQSFNCSASEFDDENNPLIKKYREHFVVSGEYTTDKLETFDNCELFLAITEMKKVNQQIVRLLIDGFTLYEIAEITAISYWGILKRVQQIRKELLPIVEKDFCQVNISDENDIDDVLDLKDLEFRTFVGGGENE